MEQVPYERRLPVGAELMPGGGVHFRVWAPLRHSVDVVFEPTGSMAMGAVSLSAEKNGYFSGFSAEASAGALYKFRLDGGASYPDPASRFQPAGPHGSSCVINPLTFSWSDSTWPGVPPQGQVIYEMHIGTFTHEGTLKAATEELPELAQLGITVVEIMPVAEFPGDFGWGYDGVNLFAPTRLYGEPDDLRRFVDSAHKVGIGVILDVVYNHLGPEGNYLKQYSHEYFTSRYENEWGEAFNYDGHNAGPVREYFIANARYWIEEYHFDGLRLDATQSIFDSSPCHIISCLVRSAREAGAKKQIYIVIENEPQNSLLITSPEAGGLGCDAAWNDDFHHSLQVALTGYNEAYYSEHLGQPQELISAVKRGYLYQGQRYFWQNKRRGTSTAGLSPHNFIHFLENHDQIANSARGSRIHQKTGPGKFKAATAFLLLGPATPMLFQGQEFAASSPFLYFADLNPDVAQLVRKGRVEFLRQFSNIASPDFIARLDNPSARSTFERSRLNLEERKLYGEIYLLHKDLLKLRRQDPVFRDPRPGGVDGAVLGPEGFVLKFSGAEEDRLMLVNFGRDLRLRPAPEPLLAPPEKCKWYVLWSSESPEYGGSGTPELEGDDFWRVPGHATIILAPIQEKST